MSGAETMQATEAELRTVGMLVPPAQGSIPEDGLRWLPRRGRIESWGVGVTELSDAGYRAGLERLAVGARVLASRGATTISIMGTSLSFFRGRAGNDLAKAVVHEVFDGPVTTMTDAIVDALRVATPRRVAALTAYTADVDAALRAYLEAEGLEVGTIHGLGIRSVTAVASVDVDHLVSAALDVLRADPDADVLLISCGGLRTEQVVPRLESETGLPVISSSLAGLHDVARRAGWPDAMAGAPTLFGR